MSLKQNIQPWLSCAIALFTLPCYALTFNSPVLADVPAFAEITQILGPNNVGLRVDGRATPTDVGGRLGQTPDALYLPGDARTFADLDFYNSTGQSSGTRVQTRTQNQLTTLYYFPCTLSLGGSAIVEWANQGGGGRSCENGFRVGSSPRGNAQLPDQPAEIFQALKQAFLKQVFSKQVLNAQAPSSRFQFYCSVASSSGQGWIGVQASGNPCQQPLQQCQATGTGCSVLMVDRWTVRETELTAMVTCQGNQIFTAVGSGSTMPEIMTQLWQQAQTQGATFCALHVLAADESIAAPNPSGERTIVEIQDTDPCITYKVVQGTADIRSVKRPQGITVEPGQRYRYCDTEIDDPIESFDQSIESIELQVFLAPERGYQLCDQQQSSGGQEGDIRTIQLTANSGELRIDYEMYSVPDRLQVTYEGKNLVDTGFVSGSARLSIPFGGDSGRVTVDLTGNQEDAGTQWDYTLYCP